MNFPPTLNYSYISFTPTNYSEILRTMKKTIEIPEGHELIQEGNTYKIVKKKNKYPMELVSCGFIYGKLFTLSSNSDDDILIKKYATFISLVETCKAWNKIDGFEADWKTHNEWALGLDLQNRLDVCLSAKSRPLHFKEIETAALFLETFREQIELVKDLI